jgi:hypothetical protein
MIEERIRDALDRSAPGEDAAAARGWAMVQRAYAEREPVERRAAWRRRLVRVALAAVVVVILAVGVVVPPGRAVAEWVGQRLALTGEVDRPQLVEPPRSEPSPPPLALPATGRLLVVNHLGPWVVEQDGRRRLLGRYDDATWSPRGLFVAVVRGHELLAVEPGTGRVRWSITQPGEVAAPRWSPGDGFRVAYLMRAGNSWQQRVVNGDGTGDRLLAPAANVAPAWRPDDGARHVLAHVLPRGAVAITRVDAPAGRRVHESNVRPVALVWTDDGSRLAVVSAGSVDVLRADGRLLRRISLPPGVRARTAIGMSQGRLLVLTDDAAGSRLLLLSLTPPFTSRVLFSSPDRLADAQPAPDDSLIVATVPAADQWLVLPVSSGRRLDGIERVGERFDPDGLGRASTPRVVGWCCRDDP